MIDILTRRRQHNPILVGDAGVGKTAIVEGFAMRVVVGGNVSGSLKRIAVRILDLRLLQAGAGVKGEFEERLKTVIAEFTSSAAGKAGEGPGSRSGRPGKGRSGLG